MKHGHEVSVYFWSISKFIVYVGTLQYFVSLFLRIVYVVFDNTAIFSNRKGGGGNVGIGFAVPSNMVRTVLEAARNGRVERPWVGARLQSVTSDLAAQFGLDRPGGAVITKLAPKGP